MKLSPRGSLWLSNKKHTHTNKRTGTCTHIPQQPINLGKTWNEHIPWDHPAQLSILKGEELPRVSLQAIQKKPIGNLCHTVTFYTAQVLISRATEPFLLPTKKIWLCGQRFVEEWAGQKPLTVLRKRSWQGVFPYCCVKRKSVKITFLVNSVCFHSQSILVFLTVLTELKGPWADFRRQKQQEIADSDLFPSSTGF